MITNGKLFHHGERRSVQIKGGKKGPVCEEGKKAIVKNNEHTEARTKQKKPKHPLLNTGSGRESGKGGAVKAGG